MTTPSRAQLRPVSTPLVVTALVSTALILTPLTAGCSAATDTAPAEPAVSATSTANGPSASDAAGLSLADGWVKAAPSGMTAVFGTLRNTGTTEITLTGGSSDAADRVELHEVAMVDGVAKMRQKTGGLAIPGGGSHELAPGADHVMLLGLKGPIEPGAEVEVTLTAADGQSVTVTAVAKDFAAGNESYDPSSTGSSGAAGTHDSTTSPS